MIDFNKELDKLLADEPELPDIRELSVIADTGRRLLDSFSKTQTDISMQVEEIFDIVSETGALQSVLKTEKSRATALLDAVVGMSDIIEDFYAFARQSKDPELASQAQMMWKNAGILLEKCGITRLGEAGQPMDASIHNVRSVSPSVYPCEHVAEVLQSGYRYMGAVLRKAAVIVSTGEVDNEQNSRY